ncbi:MAG: hypothetical protein JNJ54_20410 [Myxococcaceae bacterium]|nr:hypothetical protein [Myxococcaceae bacterium]
MRLSRVVAAVAAVGVLACGPGPSRPDAGSTGGGAAGGFGTGGGFATGGGSTAGGSTAGGSTAGGSTAGGSTAGGSTAGGSAGGAVAGGSAGGAVAGGSAGGAVAGGSAGGAVAGGSAGGAVAGGSAGGEAGGSAGGAVAGGSAGGEAGGSAGGAVAGGSAGGAVAGGSAGGAVAGGSAGGMAGGSAGGMGNPGETCATAIPIGPGLLTGQDLTAYIDDYQWFGQPNCTPFGTVGRDRVYQVTIPANQRLRATVIPSPGWDPSVQITDVCVAGPNPMGQMCIAGVNAQPVGAPEVLVYLNASATPRTVSLVVDTADPNPVSFDLNIEFLTVPMGDDCSSAIALSGSATGQDLASFLGDYNNGAGCAPASGPDRVYSVSIPAGNRLTATVTSALPDGGVGFTPALNLITTMTCTPTSACVAASQAAGPGVATLLYDNVGTTPQSAFLVVDTNNPVVQGTFDITASFAPTMLPQGDVCANTAMPIITSTMLTAQPFMGYLNHYGIAVEGTTCSFDDGPDRVYAVTVPAGFRLRALGNASFPYNLDLVAGPASNCQANPVTCLDRRSSFMGGALTSSWDNGTGMAQTIFVIVDRQTPTPMTDTFDLGIDLQLIPPPPYVKTTVMAACQTLTMAATALPAALGDDVFASWAPLPFSFSFFGASVATFSVASNGYVGFSNLTTGNIGPIGSGSYTNVNIPGASAPNGIAAPFWDDLIAVTGVSQVRHETFGMPGSQRWVLEFTDFAPFPSSSPERLTFQVHVLEGTNVIEYHYCAMNPNTGSATRVTGDSATVGLEDSTGTIGVEHSFNTAMSVGTGVGLRFTP